MRLIFCLVLVFGFLAWDITADNGHYSHLVASQVDNLGEQLGLW
jgi:hypothetical protein